MAHTITALGSASEWEAVQGDGARAAQIDSTHWLVTYMGSGNDGFAVVFSIDGSGNLGWGTPFEYDTVGPTGGEMYPVPVMMDSDSAVVVYRSNTTNTGYAQTLNINTSTWNVTSGGTALNFEATSTVLSQRAVKGNASTVVVAWRGVSNDGYAIALAWNSGTGAITEPTAALEFDTANGVAPTLLQINNDPERYLVVYDGVSADGFARVLTLNTSTLALTATSVLEFDTVDGTQNELVQLDANHFLNTWWNATSAIAKAQVLEVNLSTWAITAVGTAATIETMGVDTSGQYSASSAVMTHTGGAYNVARAFHEPTASGGAIRLQMLVVNDSTWAVTEEASVAATPDSVELPHIAKVSDSRVILWWTDVSTRDGFVQSFDITTGGVFYDETGRGVAISSAVEATDRLANSETGLAIDIVSAVESTDSLTSPPGPPATYGYTELEWNVQLQAPAVLDDVYEFRVFVGSTPLAEYVVTPQLTVVVAAAGVNYNETNRQIAIAAAVSIPTDRANRKEPNLATPIVAAVSVTDSLTGAPNNYNETGRLVAVVAAVSLPTDQADYDQLALAVPIVAAVSLPTDRYERYDLARAISIVAAVATPTDQADYRELARSVAIVAGVSATDQQTAPGHYDETTRVVLITTTVTLPTDQADYDQLALPVPVTALVAVPTERAGRKELTLAIPIVGASSLPTDRYERYDLVAVPITAAVSTPTDRANRKEPALAVAVVSTISVTDSVKRIETARGVPVVAATSATDRAGRKDLSTAVPVTALVATPTDQADFKDLQRVVAVVSGVSVQDNLSGAPINYNETGRLVAIVSTITLPTDQADYDQLALAVPIVSVTAITTVVRRSDLTLSVPITSTLALTDQADFKEAVPGYIDFPLSVNGNQIHAQPGAPPVDASGSTRIECERSPTDGGIHATVGGAYFLMYLPYSDGNTYYYMYNSVLAPDGATATPAVMAAAGVPATGRWQFKITWDGVSDTLSLHGRNPSLNLDLMNETGWTQIAFTVKPGKQLRADSQNMQLGGTSGGWAGSGKIWRAVMEINGTVRADFDFRYLTTVPGASMVLASGQTATIIRNGTTPLVVVPPQSLTVTATATVTVTDQLRVQQQLSIPISSTVTTTNRAFYRNPIALDVASAVSVSSQADYHQLLAVLVLSTVSLTDLQRYASGVVLNTALALFLGEQEVSAVYLGTTQVWP